MTARVKSINKILAIYSEKKFVITVNNAGNFVLSKDSITHYVLNEGAVEFVLAGKKIEYSTVTAKHLASSYGKDWTHKFPNNWIVTECILDGSLLTNFGYFPEEFLENTLEEKLDKILEECYN